jgi:citrate lyase subunit beta/citryl-CoA lyase
MSDRSWLFVPGNRPERFDKAFAAGADVVIIDLEDAVAPADKIAARDSVRAWLTPAKPVFIRVNAATTEWFTGDLDLVALPGVRGVALPMAEDTAAIREIHGRAAAATSIVPLIETALGLWRAVDIASAPGVERLAFGSVDFQSDTGITGEREELLYARSQLVIASRVAGRIAPVDGVTVALDDDALLEEDVARARRLGFGGKLCIHPRQVAAINAGFLPQPAEVAWAKRVVEAAALSGDNAVRLDNKLIDIPIIERARALLALSSGRDPR